MSERRTFVTEYIHCSKCKQAASDVLLGRDRMLCSIMVPGWDNTLEPLPIIAGKIGGWNEQQCDDFIRSVSTALSKTLCHTLRMVVIADDGATLIAFSPDVVANPERIKP